MEKKVSRLKRARRGRAKIRELKVMRLSVHRTPRHIYAQVLDDASRVVVMKMRCRLRSGTDSPGIAGLSMPMSSGGRLHPTRIKAMSAATMGRSASCTG